jgi:hypothetical protein
MLTRTPCTHSAAIQQRFETAEQEILDRLKVEEHLRNATRTRPGMARFVEAFYFCRVGFVRANFILGARCPNDERYWIGLARNLYEEAGGGETPAHNALYRRLIHRYAGKPEGELRPPHFAEKFDQAWIKLASDAPIIEALVGFAVYEALDAPDYQMLYRALKPNIQDTKTLEFFAIHTEVRHVELFDDALGLAGADPMILERAGARVLNLQEQMWAELVHYLKAPSGT